MDTSNARANSRSPKLSAAVILIIAAVAIFVITLASAAIFFWRLERNPMMKIPTHAVPSPNAFDDYARAAALRQDKAEIDTPGKFGVSSAALLPEAAKERIVRDNAPALAALRQGFRHPYMTPLARTYPVLNFPYLPADRSFARLLVLEADWKASHGKWGEAAQISLDGLKMGADIPRGGGNIHLNAALSVSAMCRKPLRAAIEHLSLPETQSALKRLQVIDAYPWTLTQALQEEKWSTQADLLGVFRQPNWRERFLSDRGYEDSLGLRVFKAQARFTSKQRIMDDYTRYMDRVIADAQANRPASQLTAAQSDVFCSLIIYPENDWFIFENDLARYNNSHAQNAFLEIELALRAYSLRHHSYPETLAALSPDLLSSVPGDPFAPGKPLQYRKNGASYVLYSVGPDGVDDGGKAIDNPRESKDSARRAVVEDAAGDVVAGVNR